MWQERSGRRKEQAEVLRRGVERRDANWIREKRHEFYFHTLNWRAYWNIQLETVAGKWENAVTDVEVGLERMSFGVL